MPRGYVIETMTYEDLQQLQTKPVNANTGANERIILRRMEKFRRMQTEVCLTLIILFFTNVYIGQ